MSDMSKENLKQTILSGDRFFARTINTVEHAWGFGDVINDFIEDDDFEALMLKFANASTVFPPLDLSQELQAMLIKHVDKFLGIFAEEES